MDVKRVTEYGKRARGGGGALGSERERGRVFDGGGEARVGGSGDERDDEGEEERESDGARAVEARDVAGETQRCEDEEVSAIATATPASSGLAGAGMAGVGNGTCRARRGWTHSRIQAGAGRRRRRGRRRR